MSMTNMYRYSSSERVNLINELTLQIGLALSSVGLI